MQRVDLGVCRGHWFAGDPQKVAVLLPGASYVPAAPLLWFARETLQAQGWSVLQVWDEWDRLVEGPQWVSERFDAAFEYVGEGVSTALVVAKSLSTFALPTALDRDLPGVWLTPLLDEEDLRAALLRVPKPPTLLIGGAADPTWDGEFATSISDVEIFEVDGADHLLQQPGDPRQSLQALQAVSDHIGQFAGGLA